MLFYWVRTCEKRRRCHRVHVQRGVWGKSECMGNLHQEIRSSIYSHELDDITTTQILLLPQRPSRDYRPDRVRNIRFATLGAEQGLIFKLWTWSWHTLCGVQRWGLLHEDVFLRDVSKGEDSWRHDKLHDDWCQHFVHWRIRLHHQTHSKLRLIQSLETF